MGAFKRNGTANSLSTIAGMLLFLLFTVCIIVMIGAAAGTYSRITKGHETTYGTSASIRYISNKIRSCDSCEIADDRILICTGNTVSVIYCQGGGLYEKNTAADKDTTASGGSMILELDTLTVTETDGLYSITVGCDGSTVTAYIRKG